jgi:flagellin
MALAIATNTGALMAAASATSVNKDMETSMERLSTGKRINSAADDAVGLAISTRMDSQVRAMNMQVRNASDGISLIQSAEGAMQETTNILQRMYELSVQASNETFNDSDRTAIQAEITQLQAEIDRIAKDTQFNGQNILDGNFLSKTLNVGFTDKGSIGVNIGDQGSAALSGAGTTDAVSSLLSSVSNIAMGADTQTAVASTRTAAVIKVDSQTLAINQTQYNIGQDNTQSLTSSTVVENVTAGADDETFTTKAVGTATVAIVTQGHGGVATVTGAAAGASGSIAITGTGFQVGASFGLTDGGTARNYIIKAEDIKATDALTQAAIAESWATELRSATTSLGTITVTGGTITTGADSTAALAAGGTVTAVATGEETVTLGGDFAAGDQITIFARGGVAGVDSREVSTTFTITQAVLDAAGTNDAAGRIEAVRDALSVHLAAGTDLDVNGAVTLTDNGTNAIDIEAGGDSDLDLRVEITAKDGRRAMEAAGTTDVNIAYVDTAASAAGLDAIVDVRSYTIGGAVKDGDTIAIQTSGTGSAAVTYTVDHDDLVTDATQSKRNAIDSFVSLFNSSDLDDRYDAAGGLLTASRSGDDTIVFTAETASATAITFATDLTVTDRNNGAITINGTASTGAPTFTTTAATAGVAATADLVLGLGDNLKEGDVLTFAVTGALGDAATYTVTRDDIGADADATLENVRNGLVAAINTAGLSDNDAGVITAAADGDDVGTITLTATSTVAGSDFDYTLTETASVPASNGTTLTSTEATLATVTAGTASGPYEDDNRVATVSTQVVNMTATAGEIEVGDVVELTVGDTTVSHTVAAGKATAADVIAALAEKVNSPDGMGSSISTAAAGVITASAENGVLTLSSTNKGAGSTFSVSTNTINKAAVSQVSSVEFDAEEALETGDTVRLSLTDENYVEVEVTQDMVDLGAAGARLAVRDALVALSDNLENATLSADADDVDKINITGTTAGVAFTATMTETQAKAVKQQDLLTISGTIGRGDIFTADVDGVTATVTVTDEIAALRTNDERITAVRDALLTKMTETAGVSALLTSIQASGTDGILLTALAAGGAIDSTDSTTVNNTAIASQKQVDNVTLGGDAEEGDVFAIDLGDGNAVSYTVTADDAAGATAADRLNAARDGLVAAAASLAGVFVTAGDDASVVLTAAQAGVGFETAVTTTNAADVAQVEAVAFGNVEAGDTFTVSIGDESFSYTAQDGDDGAAVTKYMVENAAFSGGQVLSANDDGTLNITGAAGESFAVATATSNFAGGVQVDSLQISGTVETGDSYAVTINGADISYTVAAADTSISDVRAGLVSAINSSSAAETLNASLNDDGSISLTALQSGAGFTATASVSDVGRSRDTVATVDVSSTDGAVAAQAVIQSAIELVSATRAELGAIENRLTHTIDNLTNVIVNTEASKGRILDADFAAESTALSKSQILQQASTAMLAQANASKQSVLSLLQG